MRRRILICLAAFHLLLSGPALAGTIYTWTDANGVKRFSNSPPPEGATDVHTMDELETGSGDDDQTRQEYNRMVEDASNRADEQMAQDAEERAQAAEVERQQQADEMGQRIAAERERLQKQIDDIEGRGLGPNFSPGQKEAMIQKVQEQIDRLESDPEAYFNP